MKISVYVSDHGYGHATRTVALARELAAESGGDLRLEVLNHHAHDLLRSSLAGLRGVTVLDRPTDVGFVCREDRLSFDRGRTALRVSNWIAGWKGFVSEEVSRLRADPPDLILSDVAPEPHLVAAKLGVRSASASNFSWVDQYEPHLRPDLIAPLRGAYGLAARWYAYPMRTELSGIPGVLPVGLVTREPRHSRSDVRRRLGVSEEEVLVHLGFGWSSDAVAAAREIDAAYLPRDVRLLLPSNLAGLAAFQDDPRRVALIPEDETEAHEMIAACDLVIAKAGYSTVAEAIAGRVPVLVVPVEGSVENAVIARTIESLGIGLSVSDEGILDGRLFAVAAEMLDDLGRYRAAYDRLPSDLSPGAAGRLARMVLADAARES